MSFPPRIQRSLVIFLIVYIALLGGATYGDTNIFIRSLQHLLLTGLMVGWLINLIRRQRPFPQTAVDIPLFAWVIWLGMTILASRDWRVSLEQSWQIFMHVLGLYLLIDIMRRGRQRWIFEGLFLVAALTISISVVEIASWYFGLGFAGFNQGWFPIGGLRDPLPPELYRLSLAFNVATWLGNFVILVLPLTAAWAFTVRRKADRQALTLVSIGLVWVLMFSVSRGAFLGFVALVGIWGGIRILKRVGTAGLTKKQAWMLLAGLLIIGILGVSAVVVLSQGRSSGDEGRLALWKAALDMIHDYPVFGVGVHQFAFSLREYVTLTDTTKHLSTAHNLYLNTLAETGIPSAFLMLWLGGAFVLCWWRRWQQASSQQQIRLEAVLAALGGFCVQSMVDIFTFTSTILPILIGAAYVLHEDKPVRIPVEVYRWMRYAFLIGVVGFVVWLLRIDLAQFRLFQGIGAMLDEDYAAAQEKFDAAQSLDPHLRLYDLQKAYLLGLQANENPDVYLDSAIEAYEALQITDPNFDIGLVNLAALYAQRNDYEQAANIMQRAVAIRPDISLYWFKLAEYHDKLGDEAEAVILYQRALARSSLLPTQLRIPFGFLAASEFWDDSSPAQQAALDELYDTYPPVKRLLLAVNRDWSTRAEDSAATVQAMEDKDYDAYVALGYYANHRGDYESTVMWYQQALTLRENSPRIQAALAKAYLALGQTESAEKAARTAIFLDRAEGAAAYAVLAALSTDDAETINQLLIQAVPPQVLIPAYDNTVFAHIAFLNYLPQAKLPGLGKEMYEPWFLLAERYAADDDPETDPVEVYQAVLDDDPYIQAARDACGLPCQ